MCSLPCSANKYRRFSVEFIFSVEAFGSCLPPLLYPLIGAYNSKGTWKRTHDINLASVSPYPQLLGAGGRQSTIPAEVPWPILRKVVWPLSEAVRWMQVVSSWRVDADSSPEAYGAFWPSLNLTSLCLSLMPPHWLCSSASRARLLAPRNSSKERQRKVDQQM